MSNASRLDREVWDRFYGKWDALAATELAVEAVEVVPTERPTTDERTSTVRVGQGFFRNAVLAAYGRTCCITGVAEPQLLRASHIIPWAESERKRLDPANGVCLNALHDAAFDRGFIGIGTDLKLVISEAMKPTMPANIYAAYFGRYDGQSVRIPERFAPDPDGLRYHLETIFMG